MKEKPNKFPNIRNEVSEICIILVCLGLLMALGCSRKPVIKIYNGQWESIWLNNAIAKFIIEEGYGYPVKIVETTSQMMEEDIQKGKIDLNMEVWKHNRIDWYNDQIEKRNIVNLGMIYEASSQLFMIPKWVAEQYNITTIFDMKDHWNLFKNSEDPSKGVFYNSIIGWATTEINIVKLEAYGLTRYYNTVSVVSSEALEMALKKAQQTHKPVFGYYWSPSALMGAHDWYILEEPSYTDQCWKKIMAACKDESLRPIDHACAYITTPIDKVTHMGLLKKAPDVVEMLRKMMVGLDPLNETLVWARDNDVQNWEKAAMHYLQDYEDRWKTWVTSEVYKKIKRILEDYSM